MGDDMQRAETGRGSGKPQSSPSGDSDNTPRSEAPSISIEHTNGQTEGASDEGYFAVLPTESHTSASTSSVQASPAPSIASSSTSSLRLRDTLVDATRRLSAHLELSGRPHAYRDISSLSTESTESTSTVIGRSPGPVAAAAPNGPKFPNQAYSALQNQTYPAPHLPPNLRTKSLYPPQPVNFSAAIASLHNSGSRTVGSSPAPTPGLFSPTPKEEPADTPSDDNTSFYPSPYLHWSHRQAPKETHVADVDVDPISGRKIINEYEIIDELGRGTHGKVKLGRNLKTGEYVAIKIVERYSKKRRLGRLGNAEDKVKREVAILKKARHPNIVALLEVIDDPARKKVYIVLERVDLGEISWRTPAPKEVAMVECRRYDREARGIFDDPQADEEDQAVLDLGRLRRAKEDRSKWRKARRSRRAVGHGPDIWSIEFGGDTDDEESELDRISTSTTNFSEDPYTHVERILPRSGTPAPASYSEPIEAITPINATAPPFDIPRPSAEPLYNALEGTMYGSYEEPSRDTDLRNASRTLSHGNLMERASELLDADIHPDLLYVPCMTVQAARVAFRDTVLGLQYLHYQGIIHRDIKPPNLLQTRDHHTKISDFGVSYLGRPIDEDQAENLSESDAQDFDEAKELAKTVGTAAFYAPELCYTDLNHDNPPVNKAIDVWALGVTLFCMLFGRVPFVDMEYVVMRRIADDDVYVPSKRLRPIDSRPKSRPSSHGRHFPHAYTGSRGQFDLEYENLEDTLLDLLARLLTKDPRKRITLEEVRHHPWVVVDIGDKRQWLDETDPSRQAQGKKIEVSKEELNDAVVPIQLIDRIRSGIKKAVGSLGLGRSSSSKKRAPSTATATPSGSSSSSAINMDGRRPSLRGDESIFSALKASREGEHPLSQSVTVSPEQTLHDPFFAHTTSLSTPRAEVEPPRPGVDRTASAMSTANSVRTIRATDPGMEALYESPPSPSLSAISTGNLSSSNLGSLLSGAGRLLKTVRERSEVRRGSERKDRSRSRASSDTSDAHGDPSIAISTASAAGHLDPPQALKDISPQSASPRISRHHSSTSQELVERSDIETIDERLAKVAVSDLPVSTGPIDTPPRNNRPGSASSQRGSPRVGDSTEENYNRAENELIRRTIADSHSRPRSMNSHTAQDKERVDCPPSPDDESYRRPDDQHGGMSRSSMAPSLETSPASPNSSLMPLITPSSSEDRFAVGPTNFHSNPSIPSVMSSDDSSQPLYAHFSSQEEEKESSDLMSSGETIDRNKPHIGLPTDDEGYVPDRAIESDDDDDYDDSSDDDGGLTMMRRRSMAQGGNRSISVSNAQLARYRERRDTGGSAFSKKSSRSGSNNTMKKVRTQGDSEIEDIRGRPLSSNLGP